jgi:hypothetical protein
VKQNLLSLDQLPSNCNTPQITSSSINDPPKITTQNNNSTNHNSIPIRPVQPSFNPLASVFNGDPNQISAAIQAYLTNAQKFGGHPVLQADTINPLFYLQLMNANSMFMQQLSAIQNNTFTAPHDPIKQISQTHQQPSIPTVDSLRETIISGRNSQILQADSNVFVPKTRPMTQDEIAEHARLVYQRALQRNQLQQQSDLIKHFYDTLNIKQQESTAINDLNIPTKPTNNNEVPSVPTNVSKIGMLELTF